MTELFQLIMHAKSGSKHATAKIVKHFMPLINRYSLHEDPQVNEDCRQYIIMNLITAIPRFESAPCKSCKRQDCIQR